MNISEEAIRELIQLYKDEFDEELIYDDAATLARNLLEVYERIYQPIASEQDEREEASASG